MAGTWAVEAVMILTSTTKLMVLAALVSLLVSGVAAQHYYESGSGYGSHDSEFSVPQFESQEEILAELVAPFIFMSILLQFFLQKVLHFTLRDQDDYPAGIRLTDDRPNVRRESTLMAVTITGILIPTPFWTYVRYSIASIGLIAVTMFVGVFLFIVYLFLKG